MKIIVIVFIDMHNLTLKKTTSKKNKYILFFVCCLFLWIGIITIYIVDVVMDWNYKGM